MNERVRRRALLVSLCVLVAGLWAFMTPTLYVQARSMPYVRSADDVPSEDVLVVLGAAVQPDGQPSPYLAARLDTALDLYRRGKARVVLVSGTRDEASAYDEPRAMRRYLEAREVPAARIVEDPHGDSTYLTCRRLVDVYGVRMATVVTNDYHLPRTVALCRDAGAAVYGVADSRAKEISSGEYQRMVRREYLAAGKAVLETCFGAGAGAGHDDAVERALRTA